MRIQTYTYCFRTEDYDVDAMMRSSYLLSIVTDPRDDKFTIITTLYPVDDWF